MLKVIAFDADDTLWHNESLFALTQERFRNLLLGYNSAAEIDRRLYATEIRNLESFGYGIKGFTLSMIETAIELSGGRIPGSEIEILLGLCKEMLAAPIELLDGAAEAVARVAQRYEIILVTKGDLFDQESKVARSGLARHFSHVDIVSEKTASTYARIASRHGIAPSELLMVGNSLRSDILPALEAGARAVHIPYAITWAHEDVDANEGGYTQLSSIVMLPEWLEQLSGTNLDRG